MTRIQEIKEKLLRSAEKFGPNNLLNQDFEYLVNRLERCERALIKLRDCDWVISLPDRMDAVREIAREAIRGE